MWYVWVVEKRERGLPILELILKGKALKFYHELEDTKNISVEEQFTASEGQLDRWKKRYDIRELKISRERISTEAQQEEIEEI